MTTERLPLRCTWTASEGPATWGQLTQVTSQAQSHHGELAWMCVNADFNGHTLAEAIDLTTRFISSTPVLHQRLVLDGSPCLLQQGAPADYELTIHEIGARDPDEYFHEVLSPPRSTVADVIGLTQPTRAALVCHFGKPRHVIFSILHLVIDLGGLIALQKRFATFPAGAGTPSALDLVAEERTERMLVSSAASVARALDLVKRCDWPSWDDVAVLPNFEETSVSSERLTELLAEAARRLSVSESTMLLVGYAAFVRVVLGGDSAVIDSAFENRLLPSLKDYVGTVSQSAAAAVFFRGETAFAELCRANYAELMRSYAGGRYDVIDLLTKASGAEVIAVSPPPAPMAYGFNDHRQYPMVDAEHLPTDALTMKSTSTPRAARNALTALRCGKHGKRTTVRFDSVHPDLCGETARAMPLAIVLLIAELVERGDVELARLPDLLDRARELIGPGDVTGADAAVEFGRRVYGL